MFNRDLLVAWIWSGIGRVRGKDAERGDVPGWVMVTVMTAGLVVIIFGVFSDKIRDAVSGAIDAVTDGTSGN
jgi:hypothetical protein